ncbi:MAG TPA: RNA pseudouridine synthase [Candidatus Limivivens merdigallinarum]|uniref:RNA pseudouridylate synthase n=1 Tax=Candidatus Limivivens merdigallinarum TaxID=2840859 RepID=A0A9D0ZTT9_9FIRM|nr:RNA pseudouridine synthase [Candidatus Limivivens merdigallinarum]
MIILYEDQEILVVEKPASMAVESRKLSSPDLISQIRNHLALPGQGIPYVGMVHRLDQPVQGILVFAKTKKAASILSAQVQDGRMEKLYLAVTTGIPSPKTGHLRHYLLKDGQTNTSKAVPEGTKGAKLSRLDYEVLQESEGTALVKIHLLTGRHHQIRVQFSAIGCPLWGDGKYGAAPDGNGIALCAASLSFLHPSSKKRLTFAAAPAHTAFRKFSF